MLQIAARFPLGVYHAQSPVGFAQAEWPPSPQRLVGALLAAACSDRVETQAARDVLQRICESPPPEILAPAVVPVGDPEADGSATVVALRGASRWAPRNPVLSEISKAGISPRNVGRERAEVHNVGVAVGDAAEARVAFRWKDLALNPAELALLESVAAGVTFLGTSHSPVLLSVACDMDAEHLAISDMKRWLPVHTAADGVAVRVPDAGTLTAFDLRHEARASDKPGKISHGKAAFVANVPAGRLQPYRTAQAVRAHVKHEVIDPRYWGDPIILALDPASSETVPHAAASYLLTRSFRSALLGAFAPAGTPGEAPPILRARGEEAHVALVPLPFVFPRTATGARRRGEGRIQGVAVVFPHPDRCPDVLSQRLEVEQGLRQFVLEGESGKRRWISLPDAGRVFLRVPQPGQQALRTLSPARYTGPSRRWESVLPIVHSTRRHADKGMRGVLTQIAADCRHVGLPEPIEVELVDPAHTMPGAPGLPAVARVTPERWLELINRPWSHVRLTFAQPVTGPVILGRARHFGLGLCVPLSEEASA